MMKSKNLKILSSWRKIFKNTSKQKIVKKVENMYSGWSADKYHHLLAKKAEPKCLVENELI